MEARIAELAADVARVLLSPGVLAGFIIGVVAVFTGLAGRIALVVEAVASSPGGSLPTLSGRRMLGREQSESDTEVIARGASPVTR